VKLPNAVRNIQTISALLKTAEAEALATGEELPGAEHLLLSALALEDGTARRAFAAVGADPNGLREAIAAQHAEALRAIGIEPVADDLLDPPGGSTPTRRAYRATPSGQAVFHAAVDLHKRHEGPRLLGAHVVAAVAGMEHGTALRALRAMGVDPSALADAARREFEGSGGSAR
jgi:ATP-dependent Clp protease ATP-binding subunit ClpA